MKIYNMEAVEIINTFNKFLGDIDGVVIVLQRTKMQTKIKAFKEYTWIVWYINKEKKYRLFTINHSAREVTESEEKHNIKLMEESLLSNLFNIIQDDKLLKSLRNGEFTGWGINPN